MSKPDWNVAIVDGQPLEVVNAAGVAEMVRTSPLGIDEARRRVQTMFPPALAAAVERELDQ